MNNIPLNLTSGQQSLLAELCVVIAGIVRENDDEHGGLGVPDAVATVACEKILEVVERFEANAQTFGTLYDKLHRTGANA